MNAAHEEHSHTNGLETFVCALRMVHLHHMGQGEKPRQPAAEEAVEAGCLCCKYR